MLEPPAGAWQVGAMNEAAQHLLSTPLGEQLGAAHCETLAGLMHEQTLEAGELLFAHGDAADALYVVTEGSLHAVLRGDDHNREEDLVIAVLGPGGIVGELEIFTGGKRMATVTATEPSACLRLPGEVLRERTDASSPAVARLVDELARVLALRLAAVNEKLLAAWRLPEAGNTDGELAAPALRDVLEDVWAW